MNGTYNSIHQFDEGDTCTIERHAVPRFEKNLEMFQKHCKNKLVVLTTEWLPWLQTNWRDSGYERFSLVWKSNCIRQPKM